MERVVDPVIADMQCEHAEALRQKTAWGRWKIVADGYLAFWWAVAFQCAVSSGRSVREWRNAQHGTVIGALVSAASMLMILTMLLIAPPLLARPPAADWMGAWLTLLLVPQALPLSLPLALLAGVLSGARNRTLTRSVFVIVLVIGLAGSLGSVSTMVWLVPDANQAFRVAVARRHVVRGPSETPLRAVRAQALSFKHGGDLRRAGALLVGYHLRWAIGGAALLFALLGLGITNLRTGGISAALIGITGSAVYVTYVFELSKVESAIFSNETLAVTAAWLPNLALMLTAAAFLSLRPRNVCAGGRPLEPTL